MTPSDRPAPPRPASDTPAPSCQLCQGEVLEPCAVREMMFGTRDPFRYGECARCGCLQLLDPPADWSRYYPASYYAFGAPPARTGLRQYLRRVRNAGTFAAASGVARSVAALWPYPLYGARNWFDGLRLTKASRILDVGCGDGMLVRDLAEAGFQAVRGIDPYIAGGVVLPNGGRIDKAYVREIDGVFDLVMLHHSLEHIPDQVATMRQVAALMAEEGHCLVRVPTVSSWAWRHYREQWVQLDAPRHYFLHSLESLERLGTRAGLRLVRTVYDSTELQFTGSELYKRDRPLSELPGAYSPRQLRAYRARSRGLNAERQGDQVACLFRRA